MANYFDNGYGCKILFEDGKSVFLQGSERDTFIDEIEDCENVEQAQELMNSYLDVAE